ncbi:MAG TPA: AIR synthase related protein, partial [Nitrososphaerales archaeon]|nr:AIR synthase related protein [Nitrososphaerales archaeon]
APLVPRSARKPRNSGAGPRPREDADLAGSLLSLLSSPNISSRRWVYEQYDHEVGLRTVLKPGNADASLLRLPNGSMLAVKADGNSRHSFLDPRRGGAGCVAEASRNVVAVGAEPLAVVDHLQFGDPSDEEVYWTFRETVEGMAQYCTALPLPVVGGKVSFYNEDASTKKAIKPSPVAMVVGLMPASVGRVQTGFRAGGESIFAIGTTAPEMGGSEYYEEVLNVQGGEVPLPDARRDATVYHAVRGLIGSGLASAVHDCSKGGLGVTVSEMCIQGALGAEVDLGRIPGGSLSPSEALFSESHGRFVASVKNATKASAFLAKSQVAFARVGATGGNAIRFSRGEKALASVGVDAAVDAWDTPLGRLME